MPVSLKYFEALWLSSLILGTAVVGMMYDSLKDLITFEQIAMIQGGSVATAVVLVFLTSRLRSRIAQWSLVVMFVIELFPQAVFLIDFLAQGLIGILSLLQLFFQCLALYFLFVPESQEWIRKIESI